MSRNADLALSEATESPRVRRLAAWGVHAFTASGAVVALAALLSAAALDLRRAALLMLVALFIDSVDGTLARRARVSEWVPGLDGRRLDDIVDYLNYVIVPAVFMVAAGSLLHWGFAAVPVLASAYGFSQAEAKTEDDFFLGFPSYWNVIAIYLWGLSVGPLAGTVWVALFSAAVFIPLKYLYPSKMRVLRRTTAAASITWLLMVAAALAFPDALGRLPLLQISLLYPIYYLVVSFWLGNTGRGADS